MSTNYPDGGIQFPFGATAQPYSAALSEVLSGPRVTDYRIELLNTEDVKIGDLLSVRGGSVDWDWNAEIQSGGSLDVVDIRQDIDWLNTRIKITVLLEGAGVFDSGANPVPLGVFIPAVPKESWNATGRYWDVELLDKCSLLKSDIVTEAGVPYTFSLAAGTNAITVVKMLIEDAGESSQAIENDPSATLSKPWTWDLGTDRLKIVNDLLRAVGYRSIFTDGNGFFRAVRYVPPADRPPVYELLTPFSKGENSLMSPDWARDRDIYSIPNRYVAIAQGSGDEPALVSTMVNLDPASPFSFPSRGRWITRVVTGVEASTQQALDAIAKRGLTMLTAVTTQIDVTNIFLPDIKVHNTVRFMNPDAQLDMLCVVAGVKVPLDPLALCTTDLREAAVDMMVETL